MVDFKKGEIVDVIYSYEDFTRDMTQAHAAGVGWSLRREADLSGLGRVVNPRPLAGGRVQFGIRADRDGVFDQLLARLPRQFVDVSIQLVDPNNSYAEEGMIDGDEEWNLVETTYRLSGIVRR